LRREAFEEGQWRKFFSLAAIGAGSVIERGLDRKL
jgi:hypothetical protein